MLASRKGSTSQVAGRITSTRGRDAGNSLMKPPPIPSKGPKASAPTYIHFVYSQCVSDSFNKYGIVLSREPEFKYSTKDIWIRGLPEMYRDMIYFQDFHQRLQTMKLLRVPRAKLLSLMSDLGCGTTMLRAVAAAYRSTQMVLCTAVISASIGVRQGSPTSCLLFILLVNQLIRDLKEKCAPDDFLQWSHCLLFIDDAVIMVTTKGSALKKIPVLQGFCENSG
ncbi:hypothetical protein CAPTEDRAFT_187573 [Capitella teleta]|uniref:Reverse transcriptase domain-containing protein n=1 Tax=Capitella teleta TaxID=283909 RepID=R7ULH3_CAPTE|nr:hypothetical protein CAPTEDRAFT_187573 [Capitella teleta]|eukprot:ELU04117.1 hypothetical protein CAPTEDRAFT_187573 [Capitella teleta]